MPGKLVAIAFTRGASIRFARPITALASWITVGTRRSVAASTGGKVGYPPKPTTAAGRMRRIRRSAFMAPMPNVTSVFAIESGSRPRIVALGITWVSRAGKSCP